MLVLASMHALRAPCAMTMIRLFGSRAASSQLCTADFSSAPNLTAAAAAQSLDWEPVSVQSLSVISYSLTQNSSSASALLNLTVSAKLGVSGSITDLTTSIGGSRRRILLSTSTGKECHMS